VYETCSYILAMLYMKPLFFSNLVPSVQLLCFLSFLFVFASFIYSITGLMTYKNESDCDYKNKSIMQSLISQYCLLWKDTEVSGLKCRINCMNPNYDTCYCVKSPGV
jgi:hypothetical protein